jgi:hypothetical protein
MERRKKRHDHIRRSRSPKLSFALDLVNKSNPSPSRVDGIRSLLSRKNKPFDIVSAFLNFVLVVMIRRDLLVT